jgi:hypothetical protein
MRAALPALEKNILKFRALQMVLLLHQVESLRLFVISSIRATENFRRGVQHLPEGEKRPMEKALALLVKEEVLSQPESEDLQKIIEIRNKIGHTIHELVDDISAPKSIRKKDAIYDYFALERFERYRTKISSGMRRKFVLSLGSREVSFEQAEATYKEELGRLQKRIERQYEVRRRARAA